jgi:hypothetical protein
LKDATLSVEKQRERRASMVELVLEYQYGDVQFGELEG